jgi:threonine/homoserine/homoserine lactone efflux protein
MQDANFWLFLAAAALVASVALNTLVDAVVVLMAAATRAHLTARPHLMRHLPQGSGVFIAGLGLSLPLARRPANG